MSNNAITLTYKKPALLRRICASIIDLIVALCIGVAVTFAVDGIISSTDSYKQYNETYQKYAVDSGLYAYLDDGSGIVIRVMSDEQYLDRFYNQLLEKGDTIYQVFKSQSSYFELDEVSNLYVFKEDVTIAQKYEFYNSARDFALNNYFQQYIDSNEQSNIASYYLSVYSSISFYISVFFALLITYIIIPLLLKDGKSIGKLVFKLKVISTKGSIKISKLQVLFRGLVTIFFEFIISIYAISMFYIPIAIIISLIIMVVNKKQLCFHDLACSTLVVDEGYYSNPRESDKIYLTVNEEDYKNEQEKHKNKKRK